MEKTTLKKNQKAEVKTKSGGKYSYQYVDIAQIHDYLENNNMKYYQYIDRIDGDDYIMTVKIIDGKEQAPLRGSRVVDATLFGTDNPAQKQGSALTYARRYSLLMAFGLATEDDDAQSLSKPKTNTKVPLATDKQKEMIKSLYDMEEIKLQLITLKKSKLSDLTIKEASDLISKKKQEQENPGNFWEVQD